MNRKTANTDGVRKTNKAVLIRLKGCPAPQVKVRVKVKVKSRLLGPMRKSAPITVVRSPRNMTDL